MRKLRETISPRKVALLGLPNRESQFEAMAVPAIILREVREKLLPGSDDETILTMS